MPFTLFIKSYRIILLIIAAGYFLVLLGLGYITSRLNENLSILEAQTTNLYQHPFTVNAAARDARLAVSRIRNDLFYAAIDKHHLHPELKNNIQSHDAEFDANIKIIEANFLGDMAQVHEAKELIKSWRVARANAVSLLEKGRNDEAEKFLVEHTSPIFDALAPKLDYVVTFSAEKARYFAEKAKQESKDAKTQFRMTLTAFALFVLAAGGTTAFVILHNLRRRDQQVYREQEQIRLLSENVPGFCAFMLDTNGRVASWNEGAKSMKGYEAEEVMGKPIDIFYPPEEVSAGKPAQLIDQAVYKGVHEESGWRVRKDGSRFFADVIIKLFRDTENSLLGFIKITRNISERKKTEDQVRQLAFYDNLTNLPNRRLLHDRLRQTLAASERNGAYGALMFLDLDNFKPLNDTHGHAVGDLLLIEVAKRLEGCVRKNDTVARFGGDEFVVMLSELDVDQSESIDHAVFVAEKIRTSLAEPYLLKVQVDGQSSTHVEYHTTASIGVTLFGRNEFALDEILVLADKAMYRAKEIGRNTIHLWANTE